tara:strand:+ start:3204 stop:3821 length:618 start_codon:yes stop_codon:yes gene_type:complete
VILPGLMRLVGLMALLVIVAGGVSCSSAPRSKASTGPDATISLLPDSAVSDQWPSTALQFVVSRPSYEPGGKGRFDPRTTLAVLDPDRATWIMAGRMEDQHGLELTNQLEELIVLKSLEGSQANDGPGLEAFIHMQSQDGQSTSTLAGGQWQILGFDSARGEETVSSIILAIQDGEGRVAATAEMDLPTARDLLLRLSSAIRAPS